MIGRRTPFDKLGLCPLLLSFAMHDHDGLLHERAKRFLVSFDRKNLGPGHDQRPAGPDSLSPGDQLFAVRRRQEPPGI